MRPIFRGGEETMGILETQLKASRHAFTGEAWGMDLFPTYGREREERAARWAAFDDATEKKRGKKSAVVGSAGASRWRGAARPITGRVMA
ncbi:hypothetical protein DIPPA_27278 [Diplonema papillatum]|nr:hypothetical protein DIPPA_27278 [Diplonema papillatum]